MTQELDDRIEIDDLLTRYATAVDTRDWDLYQTVFTAEAVIDYTSSGGICGRLAEVTKWLSDALSIFSMSQHMVTNRDIRVAGDTATSRSYFYNGQFRQSVACARKTMALLGEEPVKARHGGGFGSSKVMLLTQMAQSQACLGERVGPGDPGQRLVILEVPVRPVAAGVHHPLRDALMVEVEDLLAEMEVLQHTRAALASPQSVLVVGDHDALLGRQPGRVPRHHLVNLAAGAALDPLIAILRPLVVGAGLFPARHEPSSCLQCRGAADGFPWRPPPYPSPWPRHAIRGTKCAAGGYDGRGSSMSPGASGRSAGSRR